MFQELEKCERTAIICQEKKYWKNYRKLKQYENFKVGKEALIMEGIGFNMRGWVLVFLMKRIENAEPVWNVEDMGCVRERMFLNEY